MLPAQPLPPLSSRSDDLLLALLYADGRTPLEDLADACGASITVVTRRLRGLLSRRELTLRTFVHPALDGRALAATLIAAVCDLPPDAALREVPGLWRYDIASRGRIIAVQVRVPDDQALTEAEAALAAMPTVTQVQTARWSRAWHDGHLPLAPQPIAVTDQIERLLTALHSDGRATTASLAAAAGLEPRTAADLLTQLLDARLVAIRAVPRPDPCARTHLIAVEHSRPELGQLASNLAQRPEVIELAEAEGPWPLIGRISGPATTLSRLLAVLSSQHHSIRYWPIARSLYDRNLT